MAGSCVCLSVFMNGTFICFPCLKCPSDTCLPFYLAENLLEQSSVPCSKTTSGFLPAFLGQISSYLLISRETLQTRDIKTIQYLSSLCLTFKCQEVSLFPAGLGAL